jgi:hypothetical protein
MMILASDESESRFARAADAMLSETNQYRLSQVISEYGIPIRQEEGPVLGVEDQSLKAVRVGIWQAQMENGETWFVRTDAEPRQLWANVDRIPPKRGCPRIALLGESVARAFLYDPYFTFADCLRTVLRFSQTEAEVIDLARTDLQLHGLVRLMREALALQPDAFIIFAGNNWKLSFATGNFSLLEIDRILRGGSGASELREYFDNLLREEVRQFIRTVSEIVKEHGIPVVFILPEFNLADWRNEHAEVTPLLDSAQTAAWNSAREKALESCAGGDFKLAEKFAQEMVEIDEGTTPASFEILAICARGGGNAAQARSLLEAARDAGSFFPITRSPRCYRIIQDVFRSESESNGIALVDSPRRFSEYLSGELPDRRLFLDYCHLTIDGLRITAASAVERLLPLLGKEFQPWRCLATADIDLEPGILAEAYFLASRHNAFWEQDREVIEYQCREALNQAPEIADIMLRFLDAELRRPPSTMCRAMVPLASRKSLTTTRLFSNPPAHHKDMNPLLLEPLISALTAVAPGVREKANVLLKAGHCIASAPVDLLQRPYAKVDRAWAWPDGAIYHKAYRPQSTFRIVCSTASPIRLMFTARISGPGMEERQLSLYLNAVKIASYGVSSQWRSYEVEIPGSAFDDGWNNILFQWPERSWTREERIGYLAGQLELGRLPVMWPVYGELHSFKAVANQPDTETNIDLLMDLAIADN